MKQAQTVSSVANHRTQMRIPVQIPISVILRNGHAPISAVGVDISWGGALFTTAKPFPNEAESVLICLPWLHGEYLSIEATVLRTKQLQNLQYLAAVRFSGLPPTTELKLEKLLRLLGKIDLIADSKASIKLFQEIDVIVSDSDEFRHILEQVASGRYTLFSLNTYELNQSIALSIEGPNDLPALRLRARVLEVNQPHGDMTSSADVYSLTLEFEHPRESLGPLVDYLLGLLRKGSETSHIFRPAKAASKERLVAENTRCAIETDYPELVHNLTAGWGDVSAFEVLFRDLTLGGIGQSGSLPADVWEELNFLKMVHDWAYGVSETRKSPLIPARYV